MQKSVTLYLGLNVHQDSIDIAMAGSPRDGVVRHLGSVGGGLTVVSISMRN